MASQLSHDLLAEAVDRALAGERHQRHLARLRWLEANRRARWNGETNDARALADDVGRRRHLARMPWLEANRRARWNGETHAARVLAVEVERGIGLEEMIVTAHLD